MLRDQKYGAKVGGEDVNPEIGKSGPVIDVESTSEIRPDPVRAVALDVDLSRQPAGLGQAFDAADIWGEIMRGNLSLVDHFNTEHRRYYVALRSDPHESHIRSLSSREREVLAYVAKGYSDKMIGYKLGVCKSTVGSYISSLKKKLVVSTRTALVRLVADFS